MFLCNSFIRSNLGTSCPSFYVISIFIFLWFQFITAKKNRQVCHRLKLQRNDFYDVQLLQLLCRSIKDQYSAWMRSRYFRYRSKGIGDAAPTSRFAKTSKPVQVYTACQFVKGQNTAINYFQLGNNFTVLLVANSSTSRTSIFDFWTCDHLGYKLFLKHS